jgi:hypothetical protein
VEDNNDSREIMNLSITKIGHHALKAKNSNEAISLAKAEGGPNSHRHGLLLS